MLCSDGSLSADCTNLEKERRVACGETPGRDIIELMCYDDVKLFCQCRKMFTRGLYVSLDELLHQIELSALSFV
jgi:hypothetical protein